ncbi:hypothetical protein [Corallococcus sp. CA054B]|nr:hypothetical protein [Corallococcus sp. CA054B]
MKKILDLQKLAAPDTTAVADSTSSVMCIAVGGGNSGCSVGC